MSPKKAFDIYATDIKVFYKDKEVKAYSTNGKTLISFNSIFGDAIQKQSSIWIGEKRHYSRMEAYLFPQIEGEGRGINFNWTTKEYELLEPGRSSNHNIYLYGNILKIDYRPEYTLTEFSNKLFNGLYSTSSLSDFSTHLFRKFETGSNIDGKLNGNANMVDLIVHLYEYSKDYNPATIYYSGEYENDKLKNGVSITLSRPDDPNQIGPYTVAVNTVKDFKSTVYYQKTYNYAVDHPTYFVFY